MALAYRAWLLGCFVFSVGSPARAAPGVEVTAGPASAQCVSAAELEARLRLQAPEETTRRLDVRIQPAESGGWSAVATVFDAAGTRVGERRIATPDDDCHDLDAALVVVLGALLDGPASQAPDTSAAATTQSAVAAPQPAAVVAATRTASPADGAPERDGGRARSASRRDPERPGVTFGGGVTVGALSQPVTRLHFGTRLPLAPRWSVRGSLGFTPSPGTVPLDTAEVRFSLASATLLGCWSAVRLGSAQVDACAGGEPGVIVANTSGLERESSLLKPAFWGLLGLNAGYRLTRHVTAETYVAGGLAAARHVYSARSTTGEEIEVRPTHVARLDLGLALVLEAP